MSYAIYAALIWALAAGLGRASWPRSTAVLVALIACGVPIIGWMVLSYGPWIGLTALALGAVLLRWPLVAVLSAVRRKAGGLGAENGVGASE